MNIRRRMGRRKFDRTVLFVAVAGVLALTLTYTQSCTDSTGPTQPDISASQPNPPASAPAPSNTTPTVVASPSPNAEKPIIAVCNKATGICTFESDKLRPVNAVCTYPGQNHPIWGTWDAVVNNGDTVDVRDICTDVPGVDKERCVPVTKPVQVDFHGAGRHIGHLGPIYNLTFPANLSKEECEECVEWEEPKVTRDLVCEDEVQQSPRDDKCFVDCELTITRTWNCKEPEVKTGPHRKPVECPQCEVEWTFSHSEEVWDEWGECHDRDAFSSSTGDSCSQQRSGIRYDIYVNNCDDRTRTDETQIHDSQSCDCEETERLCHVSNKGGRDGQMNLVLTQRGHQQHLDSTKFCPPDLVGACSCDAAIAAAQACGIVATGGFFCK